MKIFIFASLLISTLITTAQSKLGFPLQIKQSISFSEFKKYMISKSYDSTKCITQKEKKICNPCWKESYDYNDFLNNYNVNEYTYTNLCSAIGTIVPSSFSAFFSKDDFKLCSLKLQFSTNEFLEIKGVLLSKYSDNQDIIIDSSQLLLQGKFTLKDANITITLIKNMHLKDYNCLLEYNDNKKVIDSENDKAKLNRINF